MFTLKPDYQQAMERIVAWKQGEILDRPPVNLCIPKTPRDQKPLPGCSDGDWKGWWLDSETQARWWDTMMTNHLWLGEAFPIAFPNLGPDLFAALYGSDLLFREGTTWSRPVVQNEEDPLPEKLAINLQHPYLKTLHQHTQALFQKAAGRYLIGYTDIHAGGDCLAGLLTPERLCLELYDNRDWIKQQLAQLTDDFLSLFHQFHNHLTEEGLPSSTWMGIPWDGPMHVPSNDFSCVISPDDFQELFLPEIRRECQEMDFCIYHLDGPDALCHLDALLKVPEIHAIQWVFGAGGGRCTDWISVYQQIQQAGKGFIVYAEPDELDTLMEHLNPQGAYLWMGGVSDEDQGQEVLKKVARWKSN